MFLKSKTRRNHTHIRLFAAFLAIMLLKSPCSYSEETSTSTTSAQEIALTGNVTTTQEGKISMDFTDVELSQVFKVLSTLSGANFVTSEEVAKKKVSLLLENVDFSDALKAITQGNGLVAQQVGEEKIYVVRAATPEEAQIPLETRVVKLKYLRATSVKILSLAEASSTGSTGGSSSSSSGSTSTSSISGSTSVGTSATISGGEPGEIVKTVEDLLSARGKVTVNDRANSLIVTDVPERLEYVEKVIQKLDYPLDQVMIEAIILERAIDFNRYLGTDWGTGSGSSNTIGTISGARGEFSIPFVNQFGDLFDRGSVLSEDSGLSFGAFDFSQLSATLRALQTDSRTKVLARPKILAVDNEPAFIKITVNALIGLNSQTTPGTSGGTNISSQTAERSEIGVTLKVTPLINDERLITLLLEPRYATADVSSLNSSFRDPRIRASRSIFTVENGKVVTISGLLQRDETKVKRKIPILGDVPFFGAFFSKWTTEKADRELIIFLRPQIIRSGDFRFIQTPSIPDELTTADEEAAEFWKLWDKPWFKNIQRTVNLDQSEKEGFLRKRDMEMQRAMTHQALSSAAQKAAKVQSSSSEVKKTAQPPSVQAKVKNQESKQMPAKPNQTTVKAITSAQSAAPEKSSPTALQTALPAKPA